MLMLLVWACVGSWVVIGLWFIGHPIFRINTNVLELFALFTTIKVWGVQWEGISKFEAFTPINAYKG